jgi:hypothetical protein
VSAEGGLQSTGGGAPGVMNLIDDGQEEDCQEEERRRVHNNVHSDLVVVGTIKILVLGASSERPSISQALHHI